MGTISAAAAYSGLRASGTPAGTNVTGTAAVGVANTTTEFTDADICYSFKVTATGNGDVATLTLTSGAVAQTTGTPTVTDGDGNDFEGVALATAVNGYAILIERSLTGSGDDIAVASSDDSNADINFEDVVGLPPMLCPLKVAGTMAFTFSASGDWVKVTVVAKSS